MWSDAEPCRFISLLCLNRIIQRLSFSFGMLTRRLFWRPSSTCCSCIFRMILKSKKGYSSSWGSRVKLTLSRCRKGKRSQNGYFRLASWSGNPRCVTDHLRRALSILTDGMLGWALFLATDEVGRTSILCDSTNVCTNVPIWCHSSVNTVIFAGQPLRR